MDESISFGCLGASGKGVTEHYGCDVSADKVKVID